MSDLRRKKSAFEQAKISRRTLLSDLITVPFAFGLGYPLSAFGSQAEFRLVSGFTPGNIDYSARPAGASAVDTSVEYLSSVAEGSYRSDLVALRDRVHSVVPNPVRPKQLLIVSKPGTESYLVSKDGRSELIRIEAAPGCIFSGHGAFSPDGSEVYIGEVVGKKGEGSITVRSATTGKLIRTLPAFGSDPHEMILTDKGRTIVQAVALESGSALQFVDVGSGKLVDSFFSPVNGQILRHFTFLGSDKFVIGCKLDDRLVQEKDATAVLVFGQRGEKQYKVLSMRDVPGVAKSSSWQFLSLAWDQESNVVGATSDTNNMVVFADPATGKVLSSLQIEKPTGIVFSKSRGQYFVNSQSGHLHLIDRRTFKLLKSIPSADMTGPHLYELPA